MTWILLLAAWFSSIALNAAQYWLMVLTRRRLIAIDFAAQDPTETEANVAIANVLTASLVEHPHNWEISDKGVKHHGGTEIFMRGDRVGVQHNGASSMFGPRLSGKIISAVQVRNARMMLKSIGDKK